MRKVGRWRQRWRDEAEELLVLEVCHGFLCVAEYGGVWGGSRWWHPPFRPSDPASVLTDWVAAPDVILIN